MTADQFRRLALGLPEAVERSHFSHPDFRVRNKIFATLGYPDPRYGMVKLTPEQQEELLCAAPETFRPAAGAWGRSGSTVVLLSATKVATLAPIIRRAWENAAANNPPRKIRRPRTSGNQAAVVRRAPVAPDAAAARRRSRPR
jgi:hypothetical protein